LLIFHAFFSKLIITRASEYMRGCGNTWGCTTVLQASMTAVVCGITIRHQQVRKYG
jgi:hypothetical protein